MVRDLQGLTLPGTHGGSLLGGNREEWGVERSWVLRHEVGRGRRLHVQVLVEVPRLDMCPIIRLGSDHLSEG